MIKCYYDLHMHSVLSPCADEAMTPNNIFNMAYLEELDMISVTDHNSFEQLNTMLELEESFETVLIPGAEITVSEGFHVLCYFKNMSDAYKFYFSIEPYINKDSYDTAYYGEQVIMSDIDEEIDVVGHLLTSPIDLDVYEVTSLIKEYGGICIMAHVDKSKTSVLNVYDNFDEMNVDGIEFYNVDKKDEFFEKYPFLKSFKLLNNSDAHMITDISQRENYLELTEKSVNGFFKYFTGE